MYIVRLTNNITHDHLEFCFPDLKEAQKFQEQVLEHQCHVPMPWEHFEEGDEKLDFKAGPDCMRSELIWKASLS